MAKTEKEAPKTEAKKGGRKIMLKDPSTGEQVARVDVIKSLYNDGEGKTRSEIRKILAEEYSHEVPYQIVFAATKTPKAAEAKTDAKAEEKAA